MSLRFEPVPEPLVPESFVLESVELVSLLPVDSFDSEVTEAFEPVLVDEPDDDADPEPSPPSDFPPFEDP